MLDSVTQETLDNEIHRLCDLFSKGSIQETLDQATQLLKRFPEATALYIIAGDANTKLKQFNSAIQNYKKAINLKPDFAVSHFNLGVAFQDKGDFKAALKSYRKAIKINPHHLEAYFNLGNILQEIGDLDDAIECYKKILKIDPNHSETYNNMGNALKAKGDKETTIQYFDKALKLNPNLAEAHNNRGNFLRDKGRLNESILSFNQAISIKPNYPDAFYNKGNSLQDQGKYLDALNSYEQALQYNPDLFEARSEKLETKQVMCNWSGFHQLETEFRKFDATPDSVKPFGFFPMEDHPERQLMRASKYVLEKYNEDPIPLPAKPKTKPNKLRIGYFSADFRDHPVSHQMAKVLATHDRSKIEVCAYSFKQTNDAMQKQIMQSVDHFKDVSDMSEKEIALLARKDNIHIAIDLMGYTRDARTNVFAFRAAPVQIHIFGGTTGSEFMDYIIADPTAVPDRLKQYYQEKIIYLPHSFMPTDNTREISTKPMTRQEMGLPEDEFVFCCFNNNYKISPREFDIWMRLLHKIKGSVLWLKETNQWAKSNLQKEAKQRGIDPSRLVFTENVTKEDHLARHKLADLFLDTFNFNAHSTACDALWAGLPLITKKGEQFVARCAASMLNAIGLPELIVKTEDDYEALALELATNKPLLTSITEKLAKNKMTTPFFDTETYTQNLEKAFEKAYTHYYRDMSPEDIWVRKS